MSPIYPKLREAGAVFGQVMGYERPTWFDPNYVSGMYLHWVVWHHVSTNLCQFDDISEERQFLCKGIVPPFIIVIVLFLLFFLFILLFLSSSPFLLSPCHHFLSRQCFNSRSVSVFVFSTLCCGCTDWVVECGYCQEYCLWLCAAMWFGRNLPTFERNVLPPAIAWPNLSQLNLLAFQVEPVFLENVSMFLSLYSMPSYKMVFFTVTAILQMSFNHFQAY